jgi:hypothetical protein
MIAHHGSRGHSFGMGARFAGDPESTGSGWSLATAHDGLRERHAPKERISPVRILMLNGKRLNPPLEVTPR